MKKLWKCRKKNSIFLKYAVYVGKSSHTNCRLYGSVRLILHLARVDYKFCRVYQNRLAI